MARRDPQARTVPARLRAAGAALIAGCGLFAGCQDSRPAPVAQASPRTVVVACDAPIGKPGPIAQPRLELDPSNTVLHRSRTLARTLVEESRPLIARGAAPTIGVELIREGIPARVELERTAPEPEPRVTMTVEREPATAPAPRPVRIVAIAPTPRPAKAEPVAVVIPSVRITKPTPVVPFTPKLQIHASQFAARPLEAYTVRTEAIPAKPFGAVIRASVTIPAEKLARAQSPVPTPAPAPIKLPRQSGGVVQKPKPSGLPKQAGAIPAFTGNRPPRAAAVAVVQAPTGNKPPKPKQELVGPPKPKQELVGPPKPKPEVVTASATVVKGPEGVPAELLRPKPPKEPDGVITVGGVSLKLPADMVKSEAFTAAEVKFIEPTKPEPTKPEPAVVKPEPVVVKPTVGPVVGAMPMKTVEPGITLPVPPLVQVPHLKAGEPSLMLVAAPQPLPFPSAVPAAPGTIDVGGVPMTYDSLSHLVEGQLGGCGGGAGCATCGGDGCSPGRPCAAGKPKCEPFPDHTMFGRAIGLMYENMCCPDPCYQPKWEAITANQFYIEQPRPINQQTIRWDWAHLALFPDRGEYLIARADGKGKGPAPFEGALTIPDMDFHDLALVTEIGKGGFSTIISLPYRSINPGIYGESAAGYSDTSITTKSLLFDSELFMLTFLMKTVIPSGNFRKGLGVGHVALEPSAVAGLRFGPRTYGVAQIAEWIPIAGDPDYAGAALRWNFALNHVLWQPIRDVQVIGTLEFMGMTFQDGAYTDPVSGSDQKLSGQTFASMAPSARMYYCDKFDMGMAYAMGITGKYFAHSQIRMEFRYRY